MLWHLRRGEASACTCGAFIIIIIVLMVILLCILDNKSISPYSAIAGKLKGK